jgi:hypothetical protein
VRVDDAALFVGEERIPRESLGDVRVDLGERALVIVQDLRRPHGLRKLLAFTRLSDARAFIEALGRPFDRTLVRAETAPIVDMFDLKRFMRPRSALVLLSVLTALVPVVWLFGPQFILVAILYPLAFLTMTLLRSRVEVGSDGIRHGLPAMGRYHPWRDVASAEAREDMVVLTLRSGDRVELMPRITERASELFQRIDAGLKAHRAACPDEEDVRLFRREEKSTRDRVKELRDLGSEALANYREVRVARDRLWRIVEDPSHDGATRATAAVALSGQLDDRERHRLRVVSEATVSPKVRVALDAVAAAADDTRVARALAELEAEEARRRA